MDIKLLDIKEITTIAEYFVICTGTSDRMVSALSDAVQKEIKQAFRLKNPRIEGLLRDGWILMDYGDIVLHIFSSHQRRYYALEELWSAGKVLLHLQ